MTNLRMKAINTEVYSSRKRAQADANMLNSDPFYPPRRVRVVERKSYGLAWGARKSKRQVNNRG